MGEFIQWFLIFLKYHSKIVRVYSRRVWCFTLQHNESWSLGGCRDGLGHEGDAVAPKNEQKLLGDSTITAQIDVSQPSCTVVSSGTGSSTSSVALSVLCSRDLLVLPIR